MNDAGFFNPGDALPGQPREAELTQGPAIGIVNRILMRALEVQASDVHIEPREASSVTRLRVDGLLRNDLEIPRQTRDAVVSRIKVLAGLDISERRLPQDGRFQVETQSRLGRGHTIDIRVSTLPTSLGEKLVLRILDAKRIPLSLQDLGMEEGAHRALIRALQNPQGLILVTGPTGSGKTSTLYSCLRFLHREEVNIVTAEDPVEYSLPGINQLEIRERIGLSFASALRSFLRQDPDIIMVGEIRDRPTAEMCVKAALTGHLVLSTLHTSDSVSAITRLLDLSVEPFLIASVLRLVCAQRLVRLVCVRCRGSSRTLPSGLPSSERQRVQVGPGSSCPSCAGSGYRGRTGLFEVLDLDSDLQDAVASGIDPQTLRRQVRQRGLPTLLESGLSKIRQGVTTREEVGRVTLDCETRESRTFSAWRRSDEKETK